ncbi:MAG: nitroreductase family deazaflavin-dependent oxidoreductase [Myxococcales bacterium]|nr:nitroreductase family deazaflavin-dependent oxidoreductase [Myxococcales bacterium]
MPRPPGLDAPWTKPIIKAMSQINTWVYRKTGGRIGGKFMYDAPVMLITTKGRRSGQPRTTPLLYLRDGANVVCVASSGGVKDHPLWYRNLVADPNVTIQIGDQVERRRARTANDDEKRTLWPHLVDFYPQFASYQSWTDRDIPVVILEPG